MNDNRDRVAAIEKAIKEKYGADAIVNPRANWDDDKEEQYLEQIKRISERERASGDQERKVDNGGFFMSKKLLNKESERNCPTCGVYSFDTKDDVYMNKYECCYKCYIQYVEGREERWKTGWRPNNGNNT